MSHTCALVRRVPYTALPSDVRRAVGAPVRIDFVRTHAMVPSEMVMLEYATEAEVRALQRQRPCIGGEALQVECLSAAQRHAFFQRHYAHWPSEWLAALDIGASYPMQSVVLRHLPFDTTAEKLEKKLQRNYALGLQIPPRIDWHMSQLVRPTTAPLALSFTVLKLPPLHAESTSAWFLVCLSKVSDAMRLVRSWHRTRFLPKKFTVGRTGDRYVVDAGVLY